MVTRYTFDLLNRWDALSALPEPPRALMKMPPELPCDGERFLPEAMEGSIALEHIHRYLFATQFVAGKRVLDLASGEGYGSAMLAETALHVTGVDADDRAIAHSATKYQRDNLKFRVGDCSRVPVETGVIDVVVSFETIEHHDQHEAMMSEIKRVLCPGGLLVISSPDRLEYSDKPGFKNPFHVKELYAAEFSELLGASFKHFSLLRQRVLFGSALVPDSNIGPLQYFDQDRNEVPSKVLPAAPYLVAVASDKRLPAIQGGLLEESMATQTLPIVRAANTQISTLLRCAMDPDSRALRNALASDWYLAQNIDLARSDLDSFAHWMNHGSFEGRVPSPDVTSLMIELLRERDQMLLAKANSPESAADTRDRDQRDELLAQHVRGELALRSQLEALQSELSEVKLQHLDQERAMHARLDARHAELREAERARNALEQELRAELAAIKLDTARQIEEYAAATADERRVQVEQERELRVQLDARHAELRAAEQAHAAREQALTAEIAAIKLDAGSKIEEHLVSAARERQTLLDRHFDQERVVQAQFDAQRAEWREAERDHVERQRQVEEVLATTRLESRQELEALRESHARDRATRESQHLEFERSIRAQLEARHEELRHAERALREREQEFEAELAARARQAAADAEAARLMLARQVRDSEGQLADMAARLGELEASWSWKIMAPFRKISEAVLSRQPRLSRRHPAPATTVQSRKEPHAKD